MTTLLVASVGGHLKQLHTLLPRLRGVDPDDVCWVTFDSVQSRSILNGQDVVYVHYPHPRDVRTTLANARAARRLLQQRSFSHAVSTGSGIAVSFLPLAARRGTSCHYIESAARISGPSLTGRLLQLVPGVRTYTQWERWAGGSWRYAGSVFDGFEAEGFADPAPLRRIVVTMGSSETHGFPRALARLAAIIPRDADVLWQTGLAGAAGLEIDARASVPVPELDRALREADVVVCHAGTGSALAAFEAGKCPVVLPRRKAHGETVDDHQVQLAEELTKRGLAVAGEADAVTLDDLRAAASRRVTLRAHPEEFRLVED